MYNNCRNSFDPLTLLNGILIGTLWSTNIIISHKQYLKSRQNIKTVDDVAKEFTPIEENKQENEQKHVSE